MLLSELCLAASFPGNGVWWQYKVSFSKLFIWPRETSAVPRQKHVLTLVKLSRDGTQPHMWGLLLLQSPPLKVRERDCYCSKPSKITKKKKLVFFKTLESDLITITFSFITLRCRKWHVLHSYFSKDLASLGRGALRTVLHAAMLIWNRKMLSVSVLQVQASQNMPF